MVKASGRVLSLLREKCGVYRLSSLGMMPGSAVTISGG